MFVFLSQNKPLGPKSSLLCYSLFTGNNVAIAFVRELIHL